MEVIIFLIALVVCIAAGFVSKINPGALAIVCAALIGVFLCNFSFNKVLGMWPMSIFMMLLMVMLFYGFAFANGTLAKVAKYIPYWMRKCPALLPIALFLLCFTVSAIGVGPFGVFAILGPIVMAVALDAGIPRLVAAFAIIGGGGMGALSPISTGGIVIKNYATVTGYGAMADAIVMNVWLNIIIADALIFLITYVLFKGWRLPDATYEKPEPFDKKQRQTLIIIAVVLALTILPSVLYAFVGSPFLKLLKEALNVSVCCAFGCALCCLLKVANEKDAFKTMPWPTILLICGVSMLIQVAVEFGIVDQLSAWLTANVSGTIAMYIALLISAAMSFFSSSLGVVVPTLSTLVPALEAITGATPGLLFSIITIAAMLSGYGPFSAGGGITLGGVTDEVERKKLYTYLLIASPVLVVFFALLVFVGIIA